MNRIEDLGKIERAKILHELFPEEIPNLLRFVQGMSRTIDEDQERIRPDWKHDKLSFEEWIAWAIEAERYTRQHASQMINSSSCFSVWLFGGEAEYMAYCLQQYTIPRKHTNAKFTLAVALLFT